MRRIPSTQALRAIESFARHGTVWQAADELNLTRSAVSHQLRLLERDLGFTILNKVGTRVELTPRGRVYARDVRKALNVISSSAERNSSQGMSGPITVSCPPGFASSWLCINLGGFIEAHPDVTVSLATPRRLDDISNPEADVFICFGHTFPPGVDVQLLKQVEFTPLCSPAYLNKFDGFAETSNLLRATLLHLRDFQDWKAWMHAVGLPIDAAQSGIRCADMNLVYSAAIASQGIAMGDEFGCRDAMERGLLLRPFDFALPSENAYYLVTPGDKLPNSATNAFVNWLKSGLKTS